ncbi:MAG: ribose 5-phosphate isomerase B [Actinobacteria bacterium]|nr:ribose 5-phosphate isomerase B [Actinomycetota bacterium]
MKIVLASDHAGIEHKKRIKELISSMGHTFIDVGTHTAESVDYPDYGQKGSEKITSGEAELGIFICGTGIGICMSANKIKGIRGAVCWNTETARLAREHNNANVLCIGARFISIEDAVEIARTFIETPASGDPRHIRRVNKIKALDERSTSGDC